MSSFALISLGVIFALVLLVQAIDSLTAWSNPITFKSLAAWTFGIWGVLMAFIGAISLYQNSDGYKEKERREAAQAAADAQPRVIREVDGCKVYTFKAAGHWHFFTRCANKTTTEYNWTERRGKTTVSMSNTIETENQ